MEIKNFEDAEVGKDITLQEWISILEYVERQDLKALEGSGVEFVANFKTKRELNRYLKKVGHPELALK